MAQDEVSLYNLALSVAGARAKISNPAENSREAENCRLWYEPIRRQVLSAAPWASVRAVQRLAVFKEQDSETWISGAPDPEYRFAYSLPQNYLHARYLYGYSRFSVSLVNVGKAAIMTNAEAAIMYYTYDQPQIQMWDANLYIAIAKALGAAICLPLSGKPQMARNALGEANAMILQAREIAANSDYEPIEQSPDWIAARGGSYTQGGPKFIFPAGPLISVPNVQ